MPARCGFDILNHDDVELGVEWGDVGRGAAGAGHVTGKVLLNLFAGGAGTQQAEQLMQSKDILPSWAEGPPTIVYASPDLVGVAFKDGRRESFKSPKKIEGFGGKVIPGNGYVTGDDPGEKFTAALEGPVKVVVDDKTLLDVAAVFIHGGTSQTQTKVGHMEGFDILGADDVTARRRKYTLTGAAIGAAVGVLGLFGWSIWRHYWGRAPSGHSPWSFRRISWSNRYSASMFAKPKDGYLAAITTAAVGAAAGAGTGYGAARLKEKSALPEAPKQPPLLATKTERK